MLNAAQRRFNRSRAGSVLILVVALLVLMALIGTAFMTMAQTDRGASAQHNFNTEADLLLEGAVNVVKSTVISDLYSGGAYRPFNETASYQTTTGVGSDSQAATAEQATASVAVNTGTPFLSDRLPSTDALVGRVANVITSQGAYWRFLTSPLMGGQYETPYWPNGYGIYGRDTSTTAGILPAASVSSVNLRWAPTSWTLNGVQYPALQALDPASGAAFGPPIIAADTDGDGIADAHFVKMATIDGITYYAAFRIVDNAAAFNVNTAWQADNAGTTTPVSNPLGDIFPTNINLNSWLANLTSQGGTADNINYLNDYRFNVANTTTTYPATPVQDYSFTTPIPPRTDFGFDGNGYYDALWMQLGRRLDDPGSYYLTGDVSMQSLPATEAINLASRFCLRDPSSLAYPTFLEGQYGIPNSMGTYSGYPTALSTPYPVNDPTDWYNQNFAFYPPINGTPNALPLRSILTVRNPVTSFVANPFNILPPTTGGYQYGTRFGDVITVTTAGSTANSNTTSTRAYAYIAPTSSGLVYPLNLSSSAAFRWYYVPMPWSTAPTKISAQTGTWGQLMLAYWSVMNDPTSSNNLNVPAGTEYRQFYSPLRNPYEKPVAGALAGTVRPQPPVGGSNASNTVIPQQEVIKLRAALAAVNAIDMRDADYNVTSERMLLLAAVNNATQLVEATVYGNEAQPYITRVYCENDNATKGSTGGTGTGTPNPQGYVGVELFNPYPFPIDLTYWNLGILQGRVTGAKTSPTYPDMKLVSVAGMTSAGFNKTTNLNTVINPQSYLVLENYASTGAKGSAIDATYRPPFMTATGNNVSYCFVSNLSQVMQDPANATGQPGGELVLLRPRQAALTSGTLTCPGLLNNAEYNENNLYDLVPADSFDFTNAMLAAQGATTFTGYYYCRPSGGANNWKFVFPGRWDPSNSPLRQDGVKSQTWNTSGNPPGTDSVMQAPPVSAQPFGTAGTATYTTNYPPIQMNNYGFAGPGSAALGAQSYPFGGFTRNLDILEAPYIGSYRLRRVATVSSNGTLVYTNSDPSWLLELNPVTMDCQQADDYDTTNANGSDDKFENIGRFCPIDGLDTSSVNVPVNDFALGVPPKTGYTPTSSLWRYHWAMKLANYLTVESPQDEQLPLIDSSFSSSGAPPQGIVHNTSGKTPAPQSYGQVATPSGASGFLANVDLNPLATYVGLPIQFLTGGNEGQISVITGVTPASGTTTFSWNITLNPPLINTPAQFDQFVIYGPPEETASLNGLVNVNTAPWPVLAGVPMVPNGGVDTGSQTSGLRQNIAIAQSIVYYRDINDNSGASPPHGHGPFKTLFELGDVPIYSSFPPTGPSTYNFRDAILGTAGTSRTTEFSSAQGNYTNTGQTPAVAAGDFQGTFLMANRVSNMLTTHSDSFTAYIEIQGWQNAETASPVLKVTRRATILIDRSKVTPVSQTVNTTNVPVN